jgi:hypothetical protein
MSQNKAHDRGGRRSIGNGGDGLWSSKDVNFFRIDFGWMDSESEAAAVGAAELGTEEGDNKERSKVN